MGVRVLHVAVERKDEPLVRVLCQNPQVRFKFKLKFNLNLGLKFKLKNLMFSWCPCQVPLMLRLGWGGGSREWRFDDDEDGSGGLLAPIKLLVTDTGGPGGVTPPAQIKSYISRFFFFPQVDVTLRNSNGRRPIDLVPPPPSGDAAWDAIRTLLQGRDPAPVPNNPGPVAVQVGTGIIIIIIIIIIIPIRRHQERPDSGTVTYIKR
jgi:hypothetical protein